MSLTIDSKLFIGTSGFSYNHWVGKFYPEGLSKTRWLSFYAERFPSVEINSSFYHLPKERTLLSWKEKVPEHFRFSLKVNRYITHIKRLKDIKEELDKFIKLSSLLGSKLGVLLFQLPGSLKYDIDLLGDFLSFLPKGYKYSIEFRDHSWFRDDVFSLLGEYDVALCNISSPKIPATFYVTGPFIYIRFHGLKKWYVYNYREEDLLPWASFIKKHLNNGKKCYVYFNNDAFGYALSNLILLKKLIEKG